MRIVSVCFISVLFTLGSVAQKRPNIIFFLVDDMGWQDTSEPFWTKMTPANKKFHTPNMTRLAKEGMKFTNAYTYNVCSPTRVTLMTGMNSARHKVTNWTQRKDKLTDNVLATDTIQPPHWNVNGLNPQPGVNQSVYASTLPQVLKNQGYFTVISGKAHFASGGNEGADPTTLGFDVNIGGTAAGQPQSYLGTDNYGNIPGNTTFWAVPNLKKYHGTKTFLSDALTREALLAIDSARSKKQPFFLYMSHYAVHLPFQKDDRYYQKYIQQGLEPAEAAYSALLEGMDASLGRIMDYLESKKLDKNTIVVFMSDNGGYALPPRSGKPNTQNYPLRAGKGSLYEGGIRTPLIVKWPGVTKPSSVQTQYVTVEDLFPTFLEMASVRNAGLVQTIDGKSIVPYLRNPGLHSDNRSIYFHYPNKWYPGEPGFTSYVSAIRKGDWKLVFFQVTGKYELYNLKNDIGESTNLADSQPAKAKELAKELADKLREAGAQMPYNRISGKSLPYPDEV